MSRTSTTQTRGGKRRTLALVCGLMLLWLAWTGGAREAALASSGLPPADHSASASLVQCVTAATASERSATFSGEMTQLPGAAKMAMRFEVLERISGEVDFHTIIAPGLGAWRTAQPGVKIYKYLKQVTNLSAPADYRALVTFRWQGAHGHEIKRAERVTRICKQRLPAGAQSETTPAAGAPNSGQPSTPAQTPPATPASASAHGAA